MNRSPISTCRTSSPSLTRRKSAAQRGVAVLAVLHDLNLAARYADTIALMNKGAIIACGEPESVQTSGLLSSVFAIDLTVGAAIVAESPLIFPSRWLAGDRPAASRN